MTEKHKKELLRRAAELRPQDMTPEEAAFIDRVCSRDPDPQDYELQLQVWEERPGTIEHTIKHAPFTPEEIATAARVLRTIRETSPAAWTFESNDNLLELLERRARHDARGV